MSAGWQAAKAQAQGQGNSPVHHPGVLRRAAPRHVAARRHAGHVGVRCSTLTFLCHLAAFVGTCRVRSVLTCLRGLVVFAWLLACVFCRMTWLGQLVCTLTLQRCAGTNSTLGSSTCGSPACRCSVRMSVAMLSTFHPSHSYPHINRPPALRSQICTGWTSLSFVTFLFLVGQRRCSNNAPSWFCGLCPFPSWRGSASSSWRKGKWWLCCVCGVSAVSV